MCVCVLLAFVDGIVTGFSFICFSPKFQFIFKLIVCMLEMLVEGTRE